MIVRAQGDHWHVVLQPEHALLSEELAEAWADQGPRHPSVVTAARRHDDGWAVWERSPQVDASGKPVAFLDVDVRSHLAFYRAGIAAITEEDTYAGLLVSMHGAGIYRQRYGADTGLSLSRAAEVQPLVDAFVAEQEAGFATQAESLGVDDDLRWADYHRLQWYDRFSLVFCLREWDDPAPEPFELTGAAAAHAAAAGRLVAASATEVATAPEVPSTFRFTALGPWRARVEPWPFLEPVGRFSLLRRRYPKQPWTTESFRPAFETTVPERVEIVLEP